MKDARNGKGSIQRKALALKSQVDDNWHAVYPRVECSSCNKMISKKLAYRHDQKWVCEACCWDEVD